MDKMRLKFDVIMDENYEVFCLGKLAQLKLDYRRLNKTMTEAKQELDKVEAELQMFNHKNYREEYHANSMDFATKSSKSQYVRDLERIKNLASE